MVCGYYTNGYGAKSRRWASRVLHVDLVAEYDAAGAAGLIRRHTVEMNMNKIESVDVDQTLLGRLFNYGNVTIRGTGSSFEPLHMIDAPLKLRTTVTAG